jgi:DNA-binding protein HU-beta
VNKGQLVEALESRLGSKRAATEALEAVVDTITVTVAKGEKVAITGFGTFEKAARAARTGRNPRTGQAVKIKKTSVPRFRAGQGFKDLVSGTKKLPKNDVAVKKAPKGSLSGGASTTTKTTTKKAAAKKATAAKTTAAKKTTAKKATAAKTTAAKKTTAKKATAKKTTGKKAAAKKAPAKKVTAKKAPAKRATARKTAAKRSATR